MNSDILSELYGKYSKQLFFYALSLCKNKHTAEDLVQECFVKAILSFDNTSDKLKIWLFKVCRNLWIDQIRKNKHLAEPKRNGQEAADIGADTLAVVITREDTRKMVQALLTLPDNTREILTLSCILEVPQHEIAELWGMSNGAIRTLACRAKKLLRKKMEEIDNGF